MPRKGNFTFELVDATTKEPFTEHPGKNGVDRYVEVEPGLEYYMKVVNHSSDTVVFQYNVDGERLGYHTPIKPGDSKDDSGIWSYDKYRHEAEMKALKFSKMISRARFNESTADKNQYNNQVGIIKVSIYENIYLDGYYSMNNTPGTFTGNGEVDDHNAQDTKKYLKSAHGSKKVLQTDDGMRRNYKLGRKLKTIKVKYCTTVGLIVEGVLPKPPHWEWFKMIKPQAVSKSDRSVEPTIWNNEIRDAHGKVVQTKQHEMFDLTMEE